MKIMLVGDWSRSTMDEVGGKFAKGEDVAPDGAEMIARWHDPASKRVWIVVDTPDSLTVQRWTARWSNFMEFQAHTVIDDAEAGAVLQELGL